MTNPLAWIRPKDPLEAVGVTKASRSKRKGLTLRFGLLMVVLGTAGFGLLINGLALQRSMENVVIGRVDEDLIHSVESWAQQDSIFQGNRRVDRMPPNHYFVARVYEDGQQINFNFSSAASGPSLEDVLVDVGPHTVPSEDGMFTQWRVLAQDRGDYTIVVASSLEREISLLSGLAIGQSIVGLVVLAMIGMLAHFLIRKTLQPLRALENTAKQIAAGDLDSRAPALPENTEVGALARSTNVMMEQLQGLILELRAKEEQMRRFVGDASHELRTPLTSVKGFSELYRSGATTDTDMVIDKISEEAERMSVLVEDLLALTRAEETRMDNHPVDLLELSTSVAASLKAAYPERSIEIRSGLSGHDHLPVVSGDEGRLHQVLTNLMVNGLKHAGPDAKVKTVVSSTDTTVVVDVSDDGCGMSEADSEHIFERFYRADVSRTRSCGSGGSGLGLAIVKSLVEAHGGTVAVRSALGAGTTFRIEIPRLLES